MKNNTNRCARPTRAITSTAECQVAAAALGKAWRAKLDTKTWPKGCQTQYGQWAYFNSDGIGSANAFAQPICIQEVEDPVKTVKDLLMDREPVLKDREPASDGFGTKVMAAATQGAVAAAVAAALSACTEPFVNRLLVKRQTFAQAWQEISVKLCAGFFLTTLPTNMLKFPIFEVINIILSCTSLQGWLRGMVNGFFFCTIMLPVTNFRFRKSMNLPIENIACLYQAYIPTVSRDIVYGWARGLAQGLVEAAYLGSSIKALEAAGTAVSFTDRCIIFGIVIFVACIMSSPCNEWRGFTLQPPNRKLPFGQYFKPVNYMRSTGIGALIMGISLSMGMRITPFAKSLFAEVAELDWQEWLEWLGQFAIGFGIMLAIITLMDKYCRSIKVQVVHRGVNRGVMFGHTRSGHDCNENG